MTCLMTAQVLTGDKVETAVNIGYSTKLLTPDMYLVRVPAEGAVAGDLGDYGVTAQLEGLVDVVAKAATLESGEVGSSSSSLGGAAANSDHLALVLEGATALEAILGDDRREQLLIQLASSCKAVLACRVSPAQKRLIVGLMRRKSPDKPITLAIGDGANDVGMIQEAHVGVGISGKEGRQAVNNADFAIAQFRFLKLLCLKHGRINYRRFAKLIIYSFFKNIALVFVLFWYNNDNGWSGASLYRPGRESKRRRRRRRRAVDSPWRRVAAPSPPPRRGYSRAETRRGDVESPRVCASLKSASPACQKSPKQRSSRAPRYRRAGITRGSTRATTSSSASSRSAWASSTSTRPPRRS